MNETHSKQPTATTTSMIIDSEHTGLDLVTWSTQYPLYWVRLCPHVDTHVRFDAVQYSVQESQDVGPGAPHVWAHAWSHCLGILHTASGMCSVPCKWSWYSVTTTVPTGELKSTWIKHPIFYRVFSPEMDRCKWPFFEFTNLLYRSKFFEFTNLLYRQCSLRWCQCYLNKFCIWITIYCFQWDVNSILIDCVLGTRPGFYLGFIFWGERWVWEAHEMLSHSV